MKKHLLSLLAVAFFGTILGFALQTVVGFKKTLNKQDITYKVSFTDEGEQSEHGLYE